MSQIDRRKFLKMLGAGAAAGTTGVSLPWMLGSAQAGANVAEDYYKVPMKGNARILHITDVHGQLRPVYFREPNVNLGVGDAYGRPPHLVGKKLLDHMGLK
ncbi:MAG: twin-arginine translocation signal domain-containing protein, partial [Chromatiales bacterium]